MKLFFEKIKKRINKIKYNGKIWKIGYYISIGIWIIFIVYLFFNHQKI